MENKILLPPKSKEISGPIIFLAGPIQGTEDWQEKAIAIIHHLKADLWIASPRRTYLPGTFIYDEQVDWETQYLRRAGANGVILFWLAKEKEHDHSRAFAQTSRFEIAEWKTRHERDGAKLVVGIEGGFSGARYIKQRFSQDCPDVPFCSTLEDTCKKAIELLG